MSQTKAQLVSGTTAQDLTVDNINTTSINSGQVSGRKNLVINGAMQVAQRGTSSTSTGYQTVDRFEFNFANTDESPTQAQVDVASGTTPYNAGFRKALKITNGNQTGGAGGGDRMRIMHKIEAQNMANSGWNYTSSSSNVTLSFYIKSSVAQNFYFRVTTSDGTSQNFIMETGSLSADTWTKITKTIPGNSNLTFNNDNGIGLFLVFTQYRGTDNTSSPSLNTWAATGSGNDLYPTFPTTWYTTNDATYEITGVQLELGSTATDFEHRSFGEELQLCQRYYEENNCTWAGFTAAAQGNGSLLVNYKVTKRAAPTLSTKTAANSVQNLTSQNLQDATVGNFVVDTRINSNGYGRFYDLLAASDAEL